jgi:hypothetical protein
MNNNQLYKRFPGIKDAEDLGIAYLGSPLESIVPALPKNRINRAEYGRRLAKLESGIFTPLGYFVPVKNERGKD